MDDDSLTASVHTKDGHMPDNRVNGALRWLGYDGNTNLARAA